MINRRLPILLFLSAFLSVSGGANAAEPSLQPSETVTLINQAMRAQPGAERTAITAPYMASMQTENLSDLELFFKGEAHFLHLEPEPARDAYWEFRKRGDDLGRVAMQRLMIIRINAFDMVNDLLEKDIPDYQRRFPVKANDRYGITFVIARSSRSLIEKGRVGEALDLVARYVRMHDRFDSAYTAYRLPGQFIATAGDHGRAAEFVDMHNWAVAGLTKSIDHRLTAKAQDPEPVGPLPGIVFRSLFEDADLGYHAWTAEMMTLRDQLLDAAQNAR